MTETYSPALPLDHIEPSPTNPRKRFDATKLEELAESIRAKGVIQPIVVRPLATAAYELVAGERRFRASRLAQRETIPAMVRTLTDEDVLEIQLLENNQREDVHPIEEGMAMRRCLDSGMYGQGKAAIEKLAEKLGRSVRYVYARLQLAKLCPRAQEAFLADKITDGHAVQIAPLGETAQEKVIEALLLREEWVDGRYQKVEVECKMSVRGLRGWIAQNVTLPLAKAPFDVKADYGEGFGPCSGCMKRTGADADMSGEAPADDRCLDPSCFMRKRELLGQRRLAESQATHPTATLVSGSYSRKKQAGILKDSDWHYTTESDQNAELAILHDHDSDPSRVGEVVWIKRYGGAKKESPEEAAKRLAAEAAKDRTYKVDQSFRKLLAGAIAGTYQRDDHEELLRIVAIGWWQDLWDEHRKVVAKQMGWEKPNDLTATVSSLSYASLIEFFLRMCCVRELKCQRWDFERGDKPNRMLALAVVAGVDVELVKRDAEDKHPKPGEAKPKKPKKGAAQTSAPEEEAVHA